MALSGHRGETMTAIKICGITRLEDAEHALSLGVDAIGLNFWPRSKRRVDHAVAREIVRRAKDRARVVAIVVDATRAEIADVRESTGIRWVQLHGDEDATFTRALLPWAYQAVRARGDEGFRIAMAAPGIEVLLDASVPGEKGGTGMMADWSLAARVARARPLWLAGGLTAENVAEGIRVVRPMGVDSASGVERAPGVKDPAKVEAFVRAVRNASR
ncbi:Phosphoribosylanthranilate isomerase [Sandaracinus amylolyticus]|nr:Phosphoribosylanthranilate isomerase [Sandaracinus amylolyticus]